MLVDYFFTTLHLLIICFNLCGWIWPSTRRLHLFVVALTAGCWLVLGIWYGLGYCPITDWQWQWKEKMGESGLPDSFIKYFADKVTGKDISATLIDVLTAVGFFGAAVLSICLNFFYRKANRKKS